MSFCYLKSLIQSWPFLLHTLSCNEHWSNTSVMTNSTSSIRASVVSLSNKPMTLFRSSRCAFTQGLPLNQSSWFTAQERESGLRQNSQTRDLTSERSCCQSLNIVFERKSSNFPGIFHPKNGGKLDHYCDIFFFHYKKSHHCN